MDAPSGGGGFLEAIHAGEVLVGDGAWGTLLFARGLAAGDAPERLSLDRPDVVEEIARAYLDAGADLVTTNTFGASPLRLRAHGLEARAAEVNAKGVAAARRAVTASGRRAWVSGSIGPTGTLLVPFGEAEPAMVEEGYRVQAGALAAEGADLLCIETMTDLAEALLALRAARQAAPALPVIVTMTFDPTPRGFFTIMGVSVERAAAALVDGGATVVGANCGHGPAVLVDVARAFRTATAAPLAIQPNAGRPELRGGAVVYAEGPAALAEAARLLVEIGVSVVGGCCGTGPEHVRAVRGIVDAQAKRGVRRSPHPSWKQ